MMKNKFFFALSATFSLLYFGCSEAGEINTNTAIMQAMDKITGNVSLIEVPVNQEVIFGTFSIVVRECKTRTPEETPENFAFVDVAETTPKGNKINIFKGWMMSSSPALNAVAHPVYDVWLLKCTDKNVDTKLQMSKDELAIRDSLEMKREPAPVLPQDEYLAEEETITNGEPIDLIPSDIVEKSTEDKAQSEVIKLDGAVKETPPSTIDTENVQEGVPETLVIIPEVKEQQPEYEVIEDVVTIKEENEQPQPSVETHSDKVAETNNNDAQENIVNNTSAPQEDVEKQNETLSPEDIISQLEKELSAKAIAE